MTRLFLLLTLSLLLQPARANQDMLDYLYEPALQQEQQLLVDRVLTHARNLEYDNALTLSQTLLESTEDMRKTSVTAFGQIMVNHGIIQSATGEYGQGLTVIENGLEMIEQRTNPFSETLINAIMARALAQYSMDQPADAEDSFRRAQHIMHRNAGVYAVDQISVISWLTRTNLKLGEPLAADREQRFLLKVAEQVYGPDSVELLPVLHRLGGYFANRGSTISVLAADEMRLHRDQLFRYSVNLYQRAVSIIEQNFGENDLRLVQPLRGLANARMLQITNRKYAEAALERSLEIVQSNPNSDATDRARALIDLGDLYVITRDSRASQVYLEAWDILQENEETQELANNLFGAPVRLFPRETPVLPLERRPHAASKGDPLFVSLEYTVNADGGVSKVSVLEKNVPNEQVRLLRHRVKGTKFRPRIVDAEIISTDGLVMYQRYQVIERKGSTTNNHTNEDAPTESEAGEEPSAVADKEPSAVPVKEPSAVPDDDNGISRHPEN